MILHRLVGPSRRVGSDEAVKAEATSKPSWLIHRQSQRLAHSRFGYIVKPARWRNDDHRPLATGSPPDGAYYSTASPRAAGGSGRVDGKPEPD